MIDLVEADKARRENLYLGRGGKRTARMAPVIASKVGRLAGKSNRVKAGLRDLDTKFRAAKLPILEGEDRLWATNMLELSDSLLRLGPELCDRLASETSPVRCEEIISNFVSRELSELSDFEIGMGSRDPR
ncbi:MAG: hypothetical protein HYX72_10420 [Acidobacteria bacterium]|nr:hypothetical protein [Acidobacteriota bacterium]